jgi:hypothetical protein
VYLHDKPSGLTSSITGHPTSNLISTYNETSQKEVETSRKMTELYHMEIQLWNSCNLLLGSTFVRITDLSAPLSCGN